MNENEIEKKLIEHIKLQGGIITPLGKLSFTSSDRIGQGGNGVVYLATINGKKIAIKFLISNSKRKYSRFKSEYFNTNYVRNDLKNIINMIYYGEFEVQDGKKIPYIVMNYYSKNLKEFRKKNNEIKENEFLALAKFFLSTLNLVHRKGIIHRDIKPENI